MIKVASTLPVSTLEQRTLPGLHAHLLSLVANLGVPRDTPVLDLGCGSGALLAALSQTGFTSLRGIDYRQPALVPGLTLSRFDLNNDDPATLGTFGLVTCIEVIEHIENVGKLLDTLAATLAPDGVAILTTPNVESLRARLRALVTGELPQFDSKGDPTHLMPILRASLAKMLERRGLTIAETRAYPAAPAKTVMFSRSTARLRNLLSPLLRDDIPGDNAVHLIRHA